MSFRGGTRGNAVPIVEILSARMGTEFPFLICTRIGLHGNDEKEFYRLSPTKLAWSAMASSCTPMRGRSTATAMPLVKDITQNAFICLLR